MIARTVPSNAHQDVCPPARAVLNTMVAKSVPALAWDHAQQTVPMFVQKIVPHLAL